LFDLVQLHSSFVAQGKRVNQFIHFVSGAGGVGKSFLIRCIRQCITDNFSNGIINTPVAVCASTGVAAALIDGTTAHQLLQLDCQQAGKINKKPLSGKKKAKMRKLFSSIRYIVIDECSMVGNTNLNQINSRLNEIYGIGPDTVHFGGINIIFVGDLHQIPAVQQTMIFDPKGMSALGPNLWKEKVSFTELTDIVRTKGDPDFTEICHRIRVGDHMAKDIEKLKTRVVVETPDTTALMDTGNIPHQC